MREPYDAEFRGEVFAACDTEERRAIAVRLNVSESWLRRIQQRRRETSQVAPRKAALRLSKWHAWAGWLAPRANSASASLSFAIISSGLNLCPGGIECIPSFAP